MSIHPILQQHIDALVADGCVVQVLADIDTEGMPDAVATKNAQNFVFRLVPNTSATNTEQGVTFPRTDAERRWDSWFAATGKGNVFRVSSTQEAMQVLNSTTTPVVTPVTPVTPVIPDPLFTYIQVHGMPQINRPNHMMDPTQYALTYTGSDPSPRQFVTYNRTVASNTQDRLQVVKEAGQNLIAFKFLTKPGDLRDNGCRSSIKGTVPDNFARYQKTFLAYQGDFTVDRFKVKFPATGFPLDAAHGSSSGDFFGLFWQWHQDDSVFSGSPPIEMLFRQHPTTGLWWVFFRYRAAAYTTGLTSQYVPWMELMTFDTWFQFEVQVRHSVVDIGTTDARLGAPGHIKVLVNGVTKLDADTWTLTPGSVYNFTDGGVYHGRLIDKPISDFFCDWEHLLVPGPVIADAAGQPSIITNPMRALYTPP